ncbi:phage tail sheath subtilisin-like domain-containing protein [Mycoplana ramosa]|uniref:Phage tail sheath subtilisin-like domain-containing protein n=1 Tax=Mycoplana ramosa TaxID=40837 RepID=A0ABW3YXE1_MYCRA
MNIPANLTAPILAFDVTSGGQFENESRVILLGHANTAGAALAAGSIAPCNSELDARLLCGAGSMLESMYLAARRNAPAQEIWIGNVAASGTPEVRTITIATVPASGGQGTILIAGRPITVTIAAGATTTVVAAALAAAINVYYDRLSKRSLPFTATAAAAVVTLTARHPGAFASGIDIFVPVTDGVNAFAGANVTLATTTPGAGVPSIANVLASMSDNPFETIISAFGDTANLTLASSFLNNIAGRWSYAQQLYGHFFYPKTGTSSDITTAGLARDDWHLTMVPRFTAGGHAEPDYEFIAAVVGRVAPWFGGGANGDVSRNQTGLVVDGVTAPRDRAYWPDYATRDAFLKNGVSTWKVDRTGSVMIDKLITQQQTTNGAPDTTFRDIQRPYQLMYALKKFRADLAAEHSNKGLADDNPDNLEAITTPKDIKATLIHSYIEMSGVLENVDAATQALVVTRDKDNPNRVNIHLELDFVNAMDIFAGLAVANSQLSAVSAA